MPDYLTGYDVSEHQPNFVLPKDAQFLFVRATRGLTRIDPLHDSHVAQARLANIPVGHYCYLEHGRIADQVAAFLSASKPQPGDMLVCDWELEGVTNAEKDQFLRELERLAPEHQNGLYCTTNQWLNVETSDFFNDFLWVADWRGPTPPIKAPWKFWQWTDTNNTQDVNRGDFTSPAELKAWTVAKVKTAPPKPGKLAPIQSNKAVPLDVDVEKVAREVEAAVYAHGYQLTLMYGTTTFPDHSNKRCVDFMTWSAVNLATGRQVTAAESRVLGDWIADYLWTHRKRFGLNWEIWWKRIRAYQNTDKSKGVWRAYTGPKPHTDHVHMELDGSKYEPPPKDDTDPPIPPPIDPEPPVTDTFKVLLWNTLRSTAVPFAPRKAATMALFADVDADLLLLQENHSDQRPPGYSWYAVGNVAVGWKKTVFELVSKFRVDLKTGSDDRAAPVAVLRHVKTGRLWNVSSVHLTNLEGGGGAGGDGWRLGQIAEWIVACRAKLPAMFKESGLLGGDLNDTDPVVKVLAQAGLVDTWDKTPIEGDTRKAIDHLASTKDVVIVKARMVSAKSGKYKGASDHNAKLAEVGV